MAKPLIPYLGGKRRLAHLILKNLPEHTYYVEVFAGAGAIYMQKEPVETEVINDINAELMNLYRVVQRHFDAFIEGLNWHLSNRSLFNLYKETDPKQLTDIERAVRFYYLQIHAFGAKVSSLHFGTATTGRSKIIVNENLKAAHKRLGRAFIECLDWQECIKRYDRPYTLFYLDPPYFETAGYGFSFPFEEYITIKNLMESMKGKCILSINAHPDIIKLFSGFRQETVDINYILAGNKGTKKAVELIIYNW